MHDVKFVDELVRIGRALPSPDREHVLAAADEISRLSEELARLKADLATHKPVAASGMDDRDRKALETYRFVHRYNSPEHPG